MCTSILWTKWALSYEHDHISKVTCIMTTNIVESLNSILKQAEQYSLLVLLDVIMEKM